MDKYTRLNILPNFQQDRLPCEGDVGDVVILTRLAKGEFDKSTDGQASVWICIKGSWAPERTNAIWALLPLDLLGTCDASVPLPPQGRPRLAHG